MRLIITFLSLLYSISLAAFNPSENGTVGLMTGYTYSQNYSDFRNSLGIQSINRQFIGLDLNTTVIHSRSSSTDAQFQFLYNIPISSSINGINYNFYGHSYGLGVFGFDLTYKSKVLDILFIPGVNWGTNKVIEDNSKYRNKFIAPKINTQIRFNIKSVSLSITADYQFDISNKDWKLIEGETPLTLPNGRPNLLNTYFSISYRFLKKQ